jgi:hypothetical protein
VLWAHRFEGTQQDQVKRPLQQGNAVVGSFTGQSSGRHGRRLRLECQVESRILWRVGSQPVL